MRSPTKEVVTFRKPAKGRNGVEGREITSRNSMTTSVMKGGGSPNATLKVGSRNTSKLRSPVNTKLLTAS